MKYIVSIIPSGHEGGTDEEIEGSGTSEEEAIADCLTKVRDYLAKNVMVELADGLCLSKDVAMTVPTPPDGFALLIIHERERWGGGCTFLAILENECTDLGESILWGSVRVFHAYSDSSGDTDHLFTVRSMVFVDGTWVP